MSTLLLGMSLRERSEVFRLRKVGSNAKQTLLCHKWLEDIDFG
jgi:hypothetical protein